MSTTANTAADANGSTAEFVFTPEQQELRSTIRRYLGVRFTSEKRRQAIETPEGYDPGAWASLAEDLGLPAITVPEALGGAGGGPVELLVIAEEMGRALYCSPWFSSCILAITALAATGDSSVADLIGDLAAARTTGTLASDELITPTTGQRGNVVATRAGASMTLDGAAEFVIDGATAQNLAVLADDEAGGSLYLVSDRTGVTPEPLATLDLTRRVATVRFAATPARRVGPEGNAAAVLRRVAVTAGLASAADSLGGMQRCLEMSTEYAKTRYQFGRPIGSFQAVKHKLANMLVYVELSRTAAQHAAWTSDRGLPDDALAMHIAQAQTSDAYLAVAAETIQAHGGIGFTWDHDAHLYFRRSKSAQLLFGDADYHRDRVADLAGF